MLLLKKENEIYRRHFSLQNKKLHFRKNDKFALSMIKALSTRAIFHLTIVKPDTLLSWQRGFIKNFWSYKHKAPGRRPRSDNKLPPKIFQEFHGHFNMPIITICYFWNQYFTFLNFFSSTSSIENQSYRKSPLSGRKIKDTKDILARRILNSSFLSMKSGLSDQCLSVIQKQENTSHW